jgi:uncharacterized membrane-anchored protein YjiN (DUF445 family)
LAAVNIHRIADIFKSIKRDSYRQQNIQRIEACMKGIIKSGDKKIGVFKINQQAEIINNAQYQQSFFSCLIFRFINSIGKKIIYDRRKHHQYYKRSACFIKKIKGEETKYITANFIVIPEMIIQGYENSKKENEKPVVEKKWVLLIVKKLLKKSMYIK